VPLAFIILRRESWYIKTSSYKEKMLELNSKLTGSLPKLAPADFPTGSRKTAIGHFLVTGTGERLCQSGNALRITANAIAGKNILQSVQ